MSIVLLKLRPILNNVIRSRPFSEKIILKKITINNNGKAKNNLLSIIQKRFSGPRRIQPMPSEITTWVVIDGVLLWFYIHLVPCLALQFGINMIYPPATLADIPADYEPEHYEYYRRPWERIIAKYFLEDESFAYESVMASMEYKYEKQRRDREINHLHMIMSQDDKYRSWYWAPIESGQYHSGKEYHEMLDRFAFVQPGDSPADKGP